MKTASSHRLLLAVALAAMPVLSASGQLVGAALPATSESPAAPAESNRPVGGAEAHRAGLCSDPRDGCAAGAGDWLEEGACLRGGGSDLAGGDSLGRWARDQTDALRRALREVDSVDADGVPGLWEPLYREWRLRLPRRFDLPASGGEGIAAGEEGAEG